MDPVERRVGVVFGAAARRQGEEVPLLPGQLSLREAGAAASPPVTSASRRNRWRLTGSSAWLSGICLSATARCSSVSRATNTAPRPPWAQGLRTRNRRPSDLADPYRVAGSAVGSYADQSGGRPTESERAQPRRESRPATRPAVGAATTTLAPSFLAGTFW